MARYFITSRSSVCVVLVAIVILQLSYNVGLGQSRRSRAKQPASTAAPRDKYSENDEDFIDPGYNPQAACARRPKVLEQCCHIDFEAMVGNKEPNPLCKNPSNKAFLNFCCGCCSGKSNLAAKRLVVIRKLTSCLGEIIANLLKFNPTFPPVCCEVPIMNLLPVCRRNKRTTTVQPESTTSKPDETTTSTSLPPTSTSTSKPPTTTTTSTTTSTTTTTTTTTSTTTTTTTKRPNRSGNKSGKKPSHKLPPPEEDEEDDS